MLGRTSRQFAFDQHDGVRQWSTYIATFTAVVIAVGLIAPRTFTFSYPLLAASFLAFGLVGGRSVGGSPEARAALWSLVAFFGYSALSALWSVAPGLAIEKSLVTAAVAVTSTLCAWQVLQAKPADARRFGNSLLIAGLIGITYLAFEKVTNEALQISFFNALGLDASSFPNRYASWQGGRVVAIDPAWINKNLIVAVVLLAPIIVAALSYAPRRYSYALAAAIYIFATIAIFKSGSETAQLALVTTSLVAVLALLSAKWTFRLLAVSWILACTMVVPLTLAVYDANWHKSPWIAEQMKRASGKERIGILRQYAIRVPEAPILGHGANSTRIIGPAIDNDTPWEVRLQKGEWMAQHPHNAYMQIWFDLGAVGAALFMVAGLLILRSFRNLGPTERPVAYATFAAFATVIAPSYGIWQYWQVCLFGLTGIALAIAIGAMRVRNRT